MTRSPFIALRGDTSVNTRLAMLPVLAAAVLLVTGCGSLRRVGKDAAVVVTSPVTVPLSASYDSLDWGERTNKATGVVLLPFNFALHSLKHIGYTAVYFADIFASPFYLLASIKEDNDLEDIDLYTLDNGYPWKSAPFVSLEER